MKLSILAVVSVVLVTCVPLPGHTDTLNERPKHALSKPVMNNSPLPLNHARSSYSTTTLSDGRVLVVGGRQLDGTMVQVAELCRPVPGQCVVLPFHPMLSRAKQSAHLLDDERLLILGGEDVEHHAIHEAEVWNWRKGTSERLHVTRGDVSAGFAWLADGRVMIMHKVTQHGIVTQRVKILGPDKLHMAEFDARGQLQLTREMNSLIRKVSARDSQPMKVAYDGALVIRDHEGAGANWNQETITLLGPTGPASIQVIPVRPEQFTVIVPEVPLLPGASYTIFLPTRQNETASLTFHVSGPAGTAVTPSKHVASFPHKIHLPATAPADADEWNPLFQHMGKRWRSGKRLPLSPGPGLGTHRHPTTISGTALRGQVFRLNGQPLEEVTLRIGGLTAQTDKQGVFFLTGLNGGRYELVIDGRTASRGDRHYGVYVVGVTLAAGIVNELDYFIWMPRVREKDRIAIPSPTLEETVLRHPDLPGLELHIPPHTVIRDYEGNIVTEIAVTPVPLDQAPYPVPENFPMYFVISPGGAVVQSIDGQPSRGIRIVYPNYANDPPGSVSEFWVHDARGRGWFVYGYGHVSADGTQVIPDPEVGLHEHMGAGHSTIGAPPPPTPAPPPGNRPPKTGPGGSGGGGGKPSKCKNGPAKDGDPVDCRQGLFVYSRTDVSLNDVMPINFTRTYRPGDATIRAFGKGTTHPYAMYLYQPQIGNYDTLLLVLPDGATIPFQRLAGIGTSLHGGWTWEHKTSVTSYYGARLIASSDPNLGETWEITLQDGTRYKLTVNSAAPLLEIRDRFGNTISIGRSGGLINRITTQNGQYLAFSNDASGRIYQAVDNTGRTWIYTYDVNGMLQKVTYPDTTFEEYTYDANGRMLTVKDRRGIVTVTNQYDAGTGRVTQQTLAANTPDQAIYQFAYTTDGNGNVTQTDVTDPRGKIRRITYHPTGYPATDTDAVGTPEEQTLTFERDATSGLPLTITDALGRKTRYTYDSWGNVLTMTRMADTSEAVTGTFTYTPDYHLLKTQTDPLNHTTTYAYNALGQLTSITDPENHVTSFTYNAAGQPLTMTDPLNHTVTLTYDTGVLRSVTDALSRTTTYVTDQLGRVVQAIDPLGNRTQMEYDTVDRVTKITDPLTQVTQFTYDGISNVLTLKDAKTQTTTFTYDNLGRPKTRKDALLRTETRVYDGMDNLTSVTDRKGQITTYQYDGLNRLKLATYHGGTTSTTYTYDAGDRLTQLVDSVSGTITRTYDNLDRLTSETTPQGTVGYIYDNASRRATMTVGGQTGISYTYDNANRLTTITQGTNSVGFTYDAANRTTQVTLPNNLLMVYGFDNANQLTGITYKQGSTTLGNLTYAYDNAGRRTTVGGTWARSGLPVAAPAAGVTVNANNQALTFGGTTLTYDLNGNLATAQDAGGTATYTWDVRNRLTSLTAPGFAATFAYDALGRRTGKTVQGVTTNFVYDGLNPVQEKNGATITANLLTGLGIDQLFTRTDGAGTSEIFTDALGSTVALADTAGTVQTSYTYESFGGTTQSGSASTNSFKYTGREDDGTGLYYYRARYYSPRLQRFVSEDPIGFNGGDVNLYRYAMGNPISRRDPSGLFASYIHFGISFLAALNSGYGFSDSTAMAFWSAWTDVGTQGINDAYIHGMTPEGMSPTKAQEKWQDYRNKERAKCTNRGRGNDLHATQDPFAEGHENFPVYNGLMELSWSHIQGDWFPSWDRLGQAYDASLSTLQGAP